MSDLFLHVFLSEHQRIFTRLESDEFSLEQATKHFYKHMIYFLSQSQIRSKDNDETNRKLQIWADLKLVISPLTKREG